MVSVRSSIWTVWAEKLLNGLEIRRSAT